MLNIKMVKPFKQMIYYPLLKEISKARIEKYVTDIVYNQNGTIRDRYALSPACADTAIHIQMLFAKYLGNNNVEISPFNITREMLGKQHRSRDMFNVIGNLQGKPGNKTTVLIGAHYDTIGFEINNNNLTKKKLFPGADDNASGVAVMLELSRIFGKIGQNVLPYDLEFAAFTAEELAPYIGQKATGSSVYQILSKATKKPLKEIIILDTIGFNPITNHVDIVAFKGSDKLAGSFKKLAKTFGLDLSCRSIVVGKNKVNHMGDLQSFKSLNACLFSEQHGLSVSDKYPGNPFYHSSKDLPEILNYEQLLEITRLIYISLATRL